MNKQTNENELNCTNIENQGTVPENIENAFSDLISEYFENDTTQNVDNIQTGTVLDWDSVANGQLFTNNQTQENAQNVVTNNNNVLYNNLETINEKITPTQEVQNNGINGIYKNLQSATDNINYQNNVNNMLYNEIGNVNTQSTNGNPYGVVPVEENLLTGVDNSTNNAETINSTNTQGTDFKLTQANLPVKIGFWTKVRNFFMADSKILYSVNQTQTNTGLWNKVQNFFSFGKNK